MKKKTKAFCMAGLFSFTMVFQAGAQLTISPQLRTRTEYRNGTGTLKPEINKAAFFTSQRTRLTFTYKMNRLVLQTSLQDIRVWGQDASTISNADGAKLGLHEAWGELILANKKDSSIKSSVDYFGVKIGRQELLYDDSRLLGNLDWLQQARRHDAVVFKFLNKGWQADLGLAFNQNTEAFNNNGTYYTPANVASYIKDSKGFLVATPSNMVPLMNSAGVSSKGGNPSFTNPPSTNGMNQSYKAMQFVYAAKIIHQTKLTGLFLADHFGKYKLDSVQTSGVNGDAGYVYGRRFNQKGLNSRFTTGLLVNTSLNKTKTLSLSAAAYYQGGKDKDGLQLSAYTTTVAMTAVKGKFAYTAGWDYVSGNNAFSSSAVNHRFDPLYGTPHKFWGTMDYFYVATGSPAGGLSDPFLKIKYGSADKRFTAGIDYHYFMLANDQKDNNGKALKKYLGSEFDVLTTYSVNKFTMLEWGFSIMAATKSMEYAKAVTPGSAQLTGVWSYIMISIRPELLIK